MLLLIIDETITDFIFTNCHIFFLTVVQSFESNRFSFFNC